MQVYTDQYLCGSVVLKIPGEVNFILYCNNIVAESIRLQSTKTLELCEVLVYGNEKLSCPIQT